MTNSEAQLVALTRGQKRYLDRLCCALCEQKLSSPGCGSIYGPACKDEFLVDKRARALLEYRPRKIVK